MADDFNGLLGTIIVGGIALRALDSRPFREPRRTVTRTRTVVIDRRTRRPIRTVTRTTRRSSRPFRLNGSFFPF